MNPFRWRVEHQVAMLSAIVLGAVVGLTIAFAVNTKPYWMLSYQDGVFNAYHLWILAGALTGGGLVYMAKLLRTG